MPTDPHTWAGDYVTATLLDNDLYLAAGMLPAANGIRFHARRPIYKSVNGASSSNSVPNGGWEEMYDNSGGNQISSVIADTPGVFGAWYDPDVAGTISLAQLVAGGGTLTSPGGLAVMIGYALWPSAGGGGDFFAGLGHVGGSSADVMGSGQAAVSGHTTCAYVLDVVDSASQQWCTFGQNNSGSTQSTVTTANADGSGLASRLLAHWVSVYPANGYTVTAAPAPLATWTLSTAVTSAFLNGNTGLRDVLRILNMPPLVRAIATGTQGLTGGSAAAVTVGTTTYDTYSGMSSSTYTVPFNGIYLCHGYVTCQNFNGNIQAGIRVNGTDYWGPVAPMPSSGESSGSKTQVFSLNAGDTVALSALASANATISSNHPARLVITYLGAQGAPSTLPTAPDTSYRWTAGQNSPNAGFTPPQTLVQLFNAHIANDLLFLTQRPYLLAYQSTAQSGIADGTPVALSLNQVKGIVHGDAGDPYSGWNSGTNTYVAQRPGWYLCVMEGFMASPSLTTKPSVLANFGPSPHGTDTWDRYQQQSFITGHAGSGAAAISYYYLRTGDSITPAIGTFDSTNTTNSTTVGSGFNSHFEAVWLGE